MALGAAGSALWGGPALGVTGLAAGWGVAPGATGSALWGGPVLGVTGLAAGWDVTPGAAGFAVGGGAISCPVACLNRASISDCGNTLPSSPITCSKYYSSFEVNCSKIEVE